MATNDIRLPRAKTPEEVGVSSKAVAMFLKETEDNQIGFHSFMVIRHGKVAAECYRAPYNAETPHQMYSVSKSLTSTAVALCVGEGLLRLEDSVLSYFPDYAPKKRDERLEKLQIKHLITMTAGKNTNILADKGKQNWVKAYFDSPWYNDPGAEWRYINENIYMLCAIIRRATGMSVRDYLQPRLFAPLGIDYPKWETDQCGVEAGGWGAFLKTEDLAKLMLLYQSGGLFNGQRILDEKWAKEAVSALADNSLNPGFDSCNGYGRCFWRCGIEDTYRADGMFSQFGIVFEKYDAIFICTAGIPCEQDARDVIWRYFPGAFFDEKVKFRPKTDYAALPAMLQNAAMDAPLPPSSSPWERKLEGKTIRMRKNVFLNLIGFPVSMLPLAVVYMSTDKAGNINDIRFSFRPSECSMQWTEGNETNTILCGMDGHYRYGEMTLGGMHYKVCCTAEWREATNLFISVRPVETIGKRMLSFRFRAENRVVLQPSSDPSVTAIANNLAQGVPSMIKQPCIADLAARVLRLLPRIAEPKHRGKIIG